MHQGHNIPWNIISTNFKFVRDDTRFTPPVTGLISKERPNAPNELKHFVKKFETAIRTFSETERAKYPANFTPLSTGNLFSDDLLDKHPDYLNVRNQRFEYWIARAQKSVSGLNPAPPIYTTSDGELADVVKVLLYENQMATLLMLARHPFVPIAQLRYLSWGHHFGFSRVMESALHAYIFFNTAEATGILENGTYASMRARYSSLLYEISAGMDYPGQQIPHRQFLKDCGVIGRNGGGWVYGNNWEESESLVHKDHGRLQEYLKTLFAVMYRYDVLVRECGLDPRWDQEISSQWPLNGIVKLEWDEVETKYVLV